MTIGDQLSGYASGLRDRAAQIIARLAQSKPAKSAPSPTASFAPPDPTKILLPGGEGDERSAPLRAGLGAQLKQSADNILAFQDLLQHRAARLFGEIEARRDGFTAILANFTRILVAASWGYIAFTMDRELLAGAPAMFGAMPEEHARTILEIFRLLAFIGASGAVLGIVLVGILGNGDNVKLRRSAENFGHDAAKIARDFDSELTNVRNAMDRHKDNYVQAIKELSQGHLTATEAATFFKTLAILDDEDETGHLRHNAEREFGAYLRKSASAMSAGDPNKFLVLLAGGIAGTLIGVFYGYLKFSPAPDVPAIPALKLLTLYPEIASIIFWPAVLYGLAGIFLDLVRGATTAGVRRQALIESLDAVRAPFTGSNAPRMKDTAQRIVDALDVYIGQVRGQFGGRGGQTNHSGASSAGFSVQSDDIPEWRRRDSSVKFVDTGFQAAPSEWRVDAYEKKLGGKPGSKRGVFGLKNPRRD